MKNETTVDFSPCERRTPTLLEKESDANIGITALAPVGNSLGALAVGGAD